MTNQPTETIRDGALKATIWQNQSESGPYYTVNFGRTYTDDLGNAQTSESFTPGQLLRIAHLATRAYDHIMALRQFDKK